MSKIDTNQLVAFHSEGLTLREISRRVGVHHTTVAIHLRNLGLSLDDPLYRKAREARYKVRVGPLISKGKRSGLRVSAEACVLCLSNIGMGRRVITRIMGIPSGMASNCLRNKSTGHKRTFVTLKSQTQTSAAKRLNQEIARSLRTRVRDSLRSQGFRKTQSARELIGCSLDQFKIHIELL